MYTCTCTYQPNKPVYNIWHVKSTKLKTIRSRGGSLMASLRFDVFPVHHTYVYFIKMPSIAGCTTHGVHLLFRYKDEQLSNFWVGERCSVLPTSSRMLPFFYPSPEWTVLYSERGQKQNFLTPIPLTLSTLLLNGPLSKSYSKVFFDINRNMKRKEQKISMKISFVKTRQFQDINYLD